MSIKTSVFQSVTAADRVDYPALERSIQKWWDEQGVLQQYLHRNDHSDKQFSFLDGPITANNPMGVHHAWGRAYKDIFQRYKTMLGYKQRYQNGFDCQGLWVEVEVEKELGFKTKLDIEVFGIAEFVQLCKERVPRRIVGRVSGVAIPAPCDQNLPICEQGRRVLSAVRDQAASRSENASSGVVEFCARCGSPAPSRLRGSSSDQNSAVAQQSGGV